MHQNCPGRIMKNSFLGHNLGVSDSAGLRQGPRICLPNKFPGDAEAAHWTSIHVFSSHSDLDEKKKNYDSNELTLRTCILCRLPSPLCGVPCSALEGSGGWQSRVQSRKSQDFPGPVVKKSTCQCREHRCSPWYRKIPRVVWNLCAKQLRPHSRVRDPQLPGPHAAATEVQAPQKKPPQWEARTPQLERSPH